MKRLALWRHIIILILIFIGSCKSHQAEFIVEVNGALINTDTIRFQPINDEFLAMKATDSMLGFRRINPVIDSPVIRITRGYSDILPVCFIVLRRLDGKWSGFTASFKPEVKWDKRVVRFVPQKDGIHNPARGWAFLFKTLSEHGIKDIGTKISYEGGGGNMDAGSIDVEYLLDGEYREYSINDPEAEDSPARKAGMNIMRLLEVELQFKDLTYGGLQGR